MPRATAKIESGEYVVVLVTCGSRLEAQRIAREIVTQRLAACANCFEAPVESVYRWKGKVEKAREFLLLVKSSRGRLAALEAEVKRLHSYDLPEFIALPIVAGSQAYFEWLGECVAVGKKPEVEISRRKFVPRDDERLKARLPEKRRGMPRRSKGQTGAHPRSPE